MPVEEVDLIFNGNSGTEAEKFIAWARRKARKEGKMRDNEWIVDLVSTSLDGGALRWYLRLDPNVRNSWDLLQLAILDNWSDGSLGSPSATIPTPAAAPTPASATSGSSGYIVPWIGVLKVFGAPKGTYVSRHPDPEYGDLLACNNRADALEIRFTPSDRPHGIEILNGHGHYRWLGVWSPRSPFDNSEYLYLTMTTAPGQGPVESLKTQPKSVGTSQCEVWNVSSLSDATVQLTWQDKGVTWKMPDVAFCEKNNWLFPVANFDAFTSKPRVNVYRQARLVFEHI